MSRYFLIHVAFKANINHFETASWIVIYHYVAFYFVIFPIPQKQMKELIYLFDYDLVCAQRRRDVNELGSY